MSLAFIIIGAQKAGSTFLQQVIGSHPRLYTPRGETPFFQSPDYSEAAFPELVATLARAADGRLIGIKRPNYLAAPEVPERVKRHAPGCRLIAVLRDPRQRAVSAYFHLMRGGSLPIRPIEEGLSDVLDGRDVDRWPNGPTLLDFGCYGKHLQRWREHFPDEQLLVQFHQDIKSRAEEMARELFRHVGVDEGHEVAWPRRRPMEGIYSLTRQRLVAPVIPIAYERFDNGRRIRPHRNPLRRAAGYAIRGLDRFVFARLFPARPPELSEGLRRRLTDYYRDDVRRLEEMTGRDLSAWRTV